MSSIRYALCLLGLTLFVQGWLWHLQLPIVCDYKIVTVYSRSNFSLLTYQKIVVVLKKKKKLGEKNVAKNALS